ncbi:hypothetical protein [aff. Roholtiella sp. LEGE 12411]|uniref:hypothetical protein n=1 Tax=aff. Roholtiella sp. LEGE 12411 TaxID=1828822 RepID=UPI00187FDB41|nr:hypothetical protein [aff. Roholtiella sp. LEGE 12411]MBE9036785.1 hypothetical protein [aff. Roholtiella sp. LEGE 12411]
MGHGAWGMGQDEISLMLCPMIPVARQLLPYGNAKSASLLAASANITSQHWFSNAQCPIPNAPSPIPKKENNHGL